MTWYIDIEDASGNRLGDGPITRARKWSSSTRMDRGGDFSFDLSASDPKADLIACARIARCYALVNARWQEIGAGVIDRIERKAEADGSITLAVSGGDLVASLAYRSVLNYGFGLGGTLPTLADALAVIATYYMPTGWSVAVNGTPPVDAFYGKFSFDTTLAALRMMAERSQTHFYYSGPNALTFTADRAASGVRAVRAPGALSAATCAIADLVQIDDSFDLVTHLYAFGGGNGDARLTLRATSLSPGPEFSLSHFNPTDGTTSFGMVSLLADSDTATLYGRRARAVQWKEIYPLSSTDADVEAAANALFYQAVQFLRQHNTPQRFYSLSVTSCPAVLRPMQTIRVDFQDKASGIVIDEDLLILEATTRCDESGVATVGLVVATVDRWPTSDAAETVSRLASGTIYQAHPQTDHNGYVISYTKSIDDAEQAQFRFRFDNEVLRLIRCTFDFQLLPLESTVKSIASASTTSSSDGSHTHTVPAHTHDVTLSNHTHGVTLSDHTHTVPAHTHGVTLSDHTHSVTLSNHTHSVPNHQHRIGISQGTGGRNVGLYTGGGMYYEGADAGVVSIYTTSDSGSTTSGSGGGTTVTSGGGGGTTATSSSGGGATSSSGGSHSHSVTPVLTTAYGIFRDSSANTFGLSDLEYSLNGTTWYGFSVGVNGFTTLGDDWYRIDLTELLADSTTYRPLSSNNALRIRRKAAGAIKRATIDAQMNIRTQIQALALT